MSTARRAAPRSRFAARVYAVVRRIPAGRVATYGDVAALAGAPRAARAVGTILRGCQDPATPCHRVIGAGGVLGGWGGPLESKRARLRHDGLRVDVVRVQEFATVRWTPRLDGSKPKPHPWRARGAR
jgi:O-6-methylguanine DNA methyltransferase